MNANDPLQTPHLLSPEDLAQDLGSDLSAGLSAAQVLAKQQQWGSNALQTKKPAPLWLRFLMQFNDPLIALLLGAMAVTLLIWFWEGAGGWPIDTVVIGAIVLFNGLLGFVQQLRSEQATQALTRLSAATASVIRDGGTQQILATDLVPGDLMLLSEGDSVSADARLVQAFGLKVHEATLTGESEVVNKNPHSLSAPAPLAERFNCVYRGTSIASGHGLALVTATGMHTELGQIAQLLRETPVSQTPMQIEVRAMGRALGIAVLLIAIGVTVVIHTLSPLDSTNDWLEVMLLAVSLAVAAVPEGLPVIVSLVLALGAQRMAGQRAIVKNLASVETLGSASIICTDKTGTLTRAEMTIQKGATASGTTHITGIGYTPTGELIHGNHPLRAGALHTEHMVLLSGGSLAGNAGLRLSDDGVWEIDGDPMEAAFLVAERKLGAHERRGQRFQRVAEIPFTSERKMMSVVSIDRESSDPHILISKGAPDVLLPLCTHIRIGQDVLPMTPEHRNRAMAEVEQLSSEALRTLSVAYRPLDLDEHPESGDTLEHDMIFVGTVGIIDPPRPEAAQAIREAQEAGIRVLMITGDHPRTAQRIAIELGLSRPEDPVVSGQDLDALGDDQLRDLVLTASVFARVSPAHKLRIVDALQSHHLVVAMTGDGVNDAPALKSADIGVAMGLNGTQVTKEAAALVLADDNFATIVTAVREGRAILDNLRKALRYLLSSNMGEILTVLLGVLLSTWIGLSSGDGSLVLPLLATQILWINLITDSGPALAMGVDSASPDIMHRPPRAANGRLVDGHMWWGAIQHGLVMAVSSLLAFDLLAPGGWFAGDRSVEAARTAVFTVLVFAQLFNAFNARSDQASVFSGGASNPWLWTTTLLAVNLQIAVVEWPVLNTAFGTVPLNWQEWGMCVCLASGVLWYSELRKVWLRLKAR